MKKFSKLFAVLAIALIALFALTACGDSPVGEWVVEKADRTETVAGVTTTKSGLDQYEDYILTIKDDGTYTIKWGDEEDHGKWTYKGNLVSFVSDDEDTPNDGMVFEKGKLSKTSSGYSDDTGISYSFTFVLKKK